MFNHFPKSKFSHFPKSKFGATLNLPVGMALWFRADSLLGGATAVSSWTDLSVNGIVATQGTATAQPQLIQNILNGYPIVRFDGGDILNFNNALSLTTSTTFIVFKKTAGTGGCIIGNTTDTTGIVNFTDGKTYFVSISDKYVAASTGNITSFNLMTITVASSTAFDFFMNRLQSGGEATGGSPSTYIWNCLGYRLGSGHNFTGDLAELITYSSVLSAVDIYQVEEYLKLKYAI